MDIVVFLVLVIAAIVAAIFGWVLLLRAHERGERKVRRDLRKRDRSNRSSDGE